MEELRYRNVADVRKRCCTRGKGCRRGESEEPGPLLFLELVRVNVLGARVGVKGDVAGKGVAE